MSRFTFTANMRKEDEEPTDGGGGFSSSGIDGDGLETEIDKKLLDDVH